MRILHINVLCYELEILQYFSLMLGPLANLDIKPNYENIIG